MVMGLFLNVKFHRALCLHFGGTGFILLTHMHTHCKNKKRKAEFVLLQYPRFTLNQTYNVI